MANEDTQSLYQFTWTVPEDGFKWVKTIKVGNKKDKPLPFLTSGIGVGEEHNYIRYSPLKLYPGLFKTFAETPPTQKGILSFANEYGLLGESVFITPDKTPSSAITGETLNKWKDEINNMNRLVELHELAKAGNEIELARYITWNENESVSFNYKSSINLIASKDFKSYILKKFPYGNVVLPTQYHIQDIVNKSLKNRITTKLLWDDNRLSYFITPKSLIGAMWHQFAKYINGDKNFKQCAQCKNWFEISPKPSRKVKLYCSNGCKFKAYRDRKTQAYELHLKGKSAKYIATQFDSDIKTVKGWIKEGASK